MRVSTRSLVQWSMSSAALMSAVSKQPNEAVTTCAGTPTSSIMKTFDRTIYARSLRAVFEGWRHAGDVYLGKIDKSRLLSHPPTRQNLRVDSRGHKQARKRAWYRHRRPRICMHFGKHKSGSAGLHLPRVVVLERDGGRSPQVAVGAVPSAPRTVSTTDKLDT